MRGDAKMSFVDSHLHLDDFDEDGSLAEVLSVAHNAGVHTMVAIGGSSKRNALAVALAEKHPGIYAAVGWDRDLAGAETDDQELREVTGHPRVVAVGESGLDYHYQQDNKTEQLDLFNRMLDLAVDWGKPIVIHSRDAEADMEACLTPYVRRWQGAGSAPAVLHCFTGNVDTVRGLLDLGLMISFSGILTFKSAGSIREAAAFVPMDRIFIETDAPYLAPVPYRGKRNQPAWVVEVAKCLAEIKQCSLEEVAVQTTRNAERFFGIKDPR